MQAEKYTGIGLVGNENISAIYAVNNGIVDINGTGIYHLFYKNYAHDLLQSAVTMIKVGDTIYYGNKIWNRHTHPVHIKPQKSYVEDHYRYCDEFMLEDAGLSRKDSVYAYGENHLVFETEIKNLSGKEQFISCYGYAAVRNDHAIKVRDNMIHTGEAYFAMDVPENEEIYIVEDSPTDFAYQVFLDIIRGRQSAKGVETHCRLGIAQGGPRRIQPQETLRFCWSLVFAESREELKKCLEESALSDKAEKAGEYWGKWLSKGKLPKREDEFADMAMTNLVALKAVCLNGYIPADLTGHYFCNKMPCYYARDSIMVARALLLSGHTEECRDIIQYLIGRERKKNGEFYQRYDGWGKPNEGANNNVFHQIDSIGYFGRIVYEYLKATGTMLAEESLLMELTDVISQAEHRHGMVGPEGGVNEGVFGGAFITSSNMFIYGGILAMKQIFRRMGNQEYEEKCAEICSRIYQGIQSAFNEELGRYDYGYVNYHDHTVEKYDTPQYFGPLYGFPNDENMKATNRYFLKYAAFFEDGIGYSEQEYHHGPWLFNTLACAEYCKKTGDSREYEKKMRWAKNHSNAYGLLPEAVDADNEQNCYINPLSWACAEFVAGYFSEGEFEHEE